LLAFVLQPLHLAPVAALPMCLHPLHPILQRKQFTRQTISHHAPTHSIASEPKSTFYVLFGFFAIIDWVHRLWLVICDRWFGKWFLRLFSCVSNIVLGLVDKSEGRSYLPVLVKIRNWYHQFQQKNHLQRTEWVNTHVRD
jgi:hypothetical protein